MKQTIFFVTRQFGRVNGGLGVSAERIAKHFATQHRVVVFHEDPQCPLGELREVPQKGDIALFRFNTNGDDRSGHQFISDSIIALARGQRPDLLVSFYGDHLATTVTLTAKWIGALSAVFLRGNDLDLDIFDMKSRLVETLTRADRVFCVSRELEDKVLTLIPTAKTVFVPNGVATEEFAYSEPAFRDRPVFGLLGDIKAKKGLALALDALDFTSQRLRLIGTLRHDKMKLHHGHLMVASEARDSVEVLPFTRDTSDLAQKYHDLDFVLIPSFHEGLPNVLLEAMSAGTIVIASRVAGMCDVVEDDVNGFLFDPWTDGDLARVIRKATSLSKSEKAQMSKLARQHIETSFSLKRERSVYLKELEAFFAVPRKAARRSLLSERYTGSKSDARRETAPPSVEAEPAVHD